MKRACAILLLSLGVIIVGIIVFVKPVGQATEWEAFQRAFPTAVQTAGFRLLASDSASREQVTPSLRSRLFSRNPTLDERLMSLYPNVTAFLFERREGGPSVRCLVKYYKGYVGRIAVRYQQQGRTDAVALWEAIRKAFPSDSVIIEQDHGG